MDKAAPPTPRRRLFLLDAFFKLLQRRIKNRMISSQFFAAINKKQLVFLATRLYYFFVESRAEQTLFRRR